MKITKILTIAVIAITLVGCASSPKSESSSAKNTGTANTKEETSIETIPVQVTIIDWADRTLGEASVPVWLKNINKGNADTFKEQYNISNNRICKLAKANARTEATAQALSRAGFAYSMAAELNQKVIGRVGQGLNDVGQLEALYIAASETKAEMAGLREEATFWQKVRTKDNEKGTTEDTIQFYTVYSMSEETWDALLKKYLIDIMGGADLTTETQKKIGALYSEMKADADKKDAQKAAEEERFYNEQMAKINAERAKANADAAAANAKTAQTALEAKKLDKEEAATKAATDKAIELAKFLL